MDIEEVAISKTQIVAFLVIGAGLYFLTSSFLISIGVMIVLIVVVNALAYFINKRRREKAAQEDPNESGTFKEPSVIGRMMGMRQGRRRKDEHR